MPEENSNEIINPNSLENSELNKGGNDKENGEQKAADEKLLQSEVAEIVERIGHFYNVSQEAIDKAKNARVLLADDGTFKREETESIAEDIERKAKIKE